MGKSDASNHKNIELRHTKNEQEQREAYKIMQERGKITYEEIRDLLDVPDETMQAVIRGLLDNGLITSHLDSEGNRKYYARRK